VTDRGKFEGFVQKPIGDFSCEACEGMCLDAVDGTLTAAEQAVFDRHVAGCVECAEQLSEARRGAAWMEMLKGHRPEPPAGMLQRILAQTSEAEMSRVFPRYGVVPTPRFEVVPVVSFQEKLWSRIAATFSFDAAQAHFQPRMAMTAAMAFFSLALTMNLTGIHLSDLRPGAIQRSVADARASAARSFQSMKVVYQVESRVNELRDDSRDPGGPFVGGSATAPKQQAPAATPGTQDGKPEQKQPAPHGSSELMLPGAPRLERVSGKKQEQEAAPDADAPPVQRGA
jgi:Putative zinc-finger